MTARAGEGPTLIESKTYRHRGHSKSDRNRYRTKEEIEDWMSNRDPITLFESELREFGFIDDKGIEAIRDAVAQEIADLLSDFEREVNAKATTTSKPSKVKAPAVKLQRTLDI